LFSGARIFELAIPVDFPFCFCELSFWRAAGYHYVTEGGPVPRIYVGNLAESVTRDDLRALFSKVGRVGGALVITDKVSGRSRGFGFVEMVEVEDAINAAVYFSGTELEGRKIHVDPYRPQEPGAQKYRGERKRRARVKRPTTSNGTA
jgi:RNA recognition motif-containing protein